MSILPTKKTAPITDPAKLTILIYGHPKIGKSTFCSELNNALFLATEPGLNSLDTYQVDVDSWQSFLNACNEVARGGHDFRTIVIDTIDQLFWMCSQHVCAKHGLDHESDAGFGKGYAFVINEFKRALNLLAALPYGLVLISHAQQIKIEDRTGDYQKITTTLGGKSKQFISGFVDMILFFDNVVKVVEGETQEVRVIRTKPSKFLDAGDRTGKLPELLKMDTKVFYKAMGIAIKANSEQVAKGAVKVSTAATKTTATAASTATAEKATAKPSAGKTEPVAAKEKPKAEDKPTADKPEVAAKKETKEDSAKKEAKK